MSALRVLNPGILSLLQDRGRFGHARLGLASGGPMDPQAFALCHRLLRGPAPGSAIEVTVGGLELQVTGRAQLCVTGAPLPVTVNGRERPMWQVLDLDPGDRLALGHSRVGCRSYVALRGRLRVAPSFGSIATVPREGIGGLRGGRLERGDELPFDAAPPATPLWLPPAQRPRYHHRGTLRVVPGYQQRHFSRRAQRRFFGSDYVLSDRCDRMGYRLTGPVVRPAIDGILSEGIALGAIQFPADGQPIVLLNDRQTIGGYPKLGCVLSLDCATLAQLRPGDRVTFTPISARTAHRALHLAHWFERSRRLEAAP